MLLYTIVCLSWMIGLFVVFDYAPRWLTGGLPVIECRISFFRLLLWLNGTASLPDLLSQISGSRFLTGLSAS